jgi:hypothetical protein
MFSKEDLEQIKERGATPDKVSLQLERLKTGFAPLEISAPATIGNGIMHITEQKETELVGLIDSGACKGILAKFVPASGAASRMFKVLFEAKNALLEGNCGVFENTGFYSPGHFFANIGKFGFFAALSKAAAKHGLDAAQAAEAGSCPQAAELLGLLLDEQGLGYGSLPKGLLDFHAYADGSRTAAEEQLVEGALYAKSSDSKVRMHFTVSENHIGLFRRHLDKAKLKYEAEYGLAYEISYSVQKPSTDTIASDSQGMPFRENGKLVFRPAGHGALIENLAEIPADYVLIKNIDNVATDRLKPCTVKYKKILLGVLIKTELEIKDFYRQLLEGHDILPQATEFAETKLGYKIPPAIANGANNEALREKLVKIMERPLRVCGMVKNNGEPGGGPFWVAASDGSSSLQIVEKAQINAGDKAQLGLLSQSTHFNPVDLAVAMRNVKAERANLADFIDQDAGIVTVKSQGGKELRALELPGLWNGAMANWNTVFVEVPLSTFNPVKEVNDLLRNEHAKDTVS